MTNTPTRLCTVQPEEFASSHHALAAIASRRACRAMIAGARGLAHREHRHPARFHRYHHGWRYVAPAALIPRRIAQCSGRLNQDRPARRAGHEHVGWAGSPQLALSRASSFATKVCNAGISTGRVDFRRSRMSSSAPVHRFQPGHRTGRCGDWDTSVRADRGRGANGQHRGYRGSPHHEARRRRSTACRTPRRPPVPES